MHGVCKALIGVGSTFWLTLPFEKDAAMPVGAVTPAKAWIPESTLAPSVTTRGPSSGASPARDESFRELLKEAGRSTVKILLVEDNPANLRVTQALQLETLGCEVWTAVNGLQAVAAYREGVFDLVLMDCQMPEMDGYQATGAIRQIEIDVGPLHADRGNLTAHAMDGSRAECLGHGHERSAVQAADPGRVDKSKLLE